MELNKVKVPFLAHIFELVFRYKSMPNVHDNLVHSSVQRIFPEGFLGAFIRQDEGVIRKAFGDILVPPPHQSPSIDILNYHKRGLKIRRNILILVRIGQKILQVGNVIGIYIQLRACLLVNYSYGGHIGRLEVVQCILINLDWADNQVEFASFHLNPVHVGLVVVVYEQAVGSGSQNLSEVLVIG